MPTQCPDLEAVFKVNGGSHSSLAGVQQVGDPQKIRHLHHLLEFLRIDVKDAGEKEVKDDLENFPTTAQVDSLGERFLPEQSLEVLAL